MDQARRMAEQIDPSTRDDPPPEPYYEISPGIFAVDTACAEYLLTLDEYCYEHFDCPVIYIPRICGEQELEHGDRVRRVCLAESRPSVWRDGGEARAE